MCSGLDGNHFSDEYDQSPMPYSIFTNLLRGLGHTRHISGRSRTPRVTWAASAWRFRMRGNALFLGQANMGPR